MVWIVMLWPIVFALVGLGIAIIYYYAYYNAPDAEQERIWSASSST